MDKQNLFSIGEVAKLFHISISSLRHYEKEGLLTPEYIDSESGYRYYSTKQFEALNSIRYLRMLNMPLKEIADFLGNRDVERMQEKLEAQKRAVIAKQEELKRIERKIDNRLHMLKDAQESVFDRVEIVRKGACRIVWVKEPLKIKDYPDMEMPIRRLDSTQAEAVVFLGKVGVGISPQNLRKKRFDAYDGIFLILDEEDSYEGEAEQSAETLCASIRFHGSHTQAPAQYKKLLAYIEEWELEIDGFSREITMIDYGLTNDAGKFVTEISIPIKERAAQCGATR